METCNPKLGDFVLVEFAGKKSRRYFVGKVTENTKSSDEITINFMRRNKKCNFTFPIIRTGLLLHELR